MRFRLQGDVALGAFNLVVFSCLWFFKASWNEASLCQYLVAGFSLVFFAVWSVYPLIFVHLSVDSEALVVRPWPLRIRTQRVAWNDIASWNEPPKRRDLIIECTDGRSLTIKLSRMFSRHRKRIIAMVGDRVPKTGRAQ